MRDQMQELFRAALGLAEPWVVSKIEFSAEQHQLDLWVDFPSGSRFACPECGRAGGGAHDSAERTWRHLNFFDHKTFLHARQPRIECPEYGVKTVADPWSRPGSGFTLLMEAFILMLVQGGPADRRARHVAVSGPAALRGTGPRRGGLDRAAQVVHRRQQLVMHDVARVDVQKAQQIVIPSADFRVADVRQAPTAVTVVAPRLGCRCGLRRRLRCGRRRGQLIQQRLEQLHLLGIKLLCGSPIEAPQQVLEEGAGAVRSCGSCAAVGRGIADAQRDAVRLR